MSKEEAIGLPLSQLDLNELSLSLVNRYQHTWPLAIEPVFSGRVDVLPLVTHHFPLARQPMHSPWPDGCQTRSRP